MKNRRAYRCLRAQELISGQFTLKTVQDDDIEDIRIWRNGQLDVLRQAEPISSSQQKKYFEHSIWPGMELERPENILLTFFEGGRRIGYGGLVHISWEHRRAEVSFLLDPTYTWDISAYSRYFSVYLSMIKMFAFSVMNLNRIYTETYDFRRKHINILESCGFEAEGRMRKHVLIDDEYFDSLIHGVINEK